MPSGPAPRTTSLDPGMPTIFNSVLDILGYAQRIWLGVEDDDEHEDQAFANPNIE